MIRPTLDTSRHGADLLHHPVLDHPKPSAKRTKPSRLPMGYLNARRPHGPELGHLQIRRPLKLRSWVSAGAAHPANAHSVTRAFPTTGKPVDRIRLDDISPEVGFPHFVEKVGYPLILRKCPPIALNTSDTRDLLNFEQMSAIRSGKIQGSERLSSSVATTLQAVPARGWCCDEEASSGESPAGREVVPTSATSSHSGRRRISL